MGKSRRARFSGPPARPLTLGALVLVIAACGPTEPDAHAPTDPGAAFDAVAPGPLDASVFVDLGAADTPAGPDVDATADVAAEPSVDASDASGPVPASPEITAISPERGTTEGGTELLVIGRRFTPDAQVFVGSDPCLDVDVVDETKIRCWTPANAPGLYPVKVATTVAQGVLPDAFRYVAPVRIDLLDPATGPTHGGVPLVIRGEGFSPEAQVSIGGRFLLGLEWVGSDELRGYSPVGEVGPRTVRVSDQAGLSERPEGFTYYEPLRLDVLLPGAGPPAGGNLVALMGSGFSDASELSVRFGLLEAELLEVDGDEALFVVAPPGPEGQNVDVTVLAAEHGARTLVQAYRYLENAGEPGVALVWPRWGTVDGGAAVVVSGLGVDDAAQVLFGSLEVEVVERGTGWIRVISEPAAGPGFVDVIVTTPSWSSQLDDGFEYRPRVAIDGVEPASGDAVGGTRVRLTGAGFEPGATVRVGPLAASSVVVTGATELTCTAPPGSVGPSPVVVTLPDGRSVTAVDGFRYTTVARVHGLNPARGSLAGGTWVLVRGAGFVAPLNVRFDDVEVAELTLLDPATVAVRTPAWDDEQYVDVSVQVGVSEPILVPERFLYYDPASPAGGVWGDQVEGSVNVTVVGANGNPLQDAFVTLDVRGESELSGVTNARGQVTLSGPDLSGRQIVSATRPGYGSSSFYGVDAENVNLTLGCTHDGFCVETSECFEGLVCAEGLCRDPPCVGQGTPPPFNPENAFVVGRLTGLDKIGDPGPGEIEVGAVWTTQPGLYQVAPLRTADANVVLENGPYSLTIRTGSLAVVAVCGFYNNETQVFRPQRMGVRRGLFAVNGETYEIDLDCGLHLDQTLTIKARGAGLSEEGPNIYRHYAYLDFGEEGYFGGLVRHEGTDDVLSFDGFAPLEGPLADLRYSIRGGSTTGYSHPYTVTWLTDVRALDTLLVLPELMPPLRLTTPDPLAEGGPVLVDGYLEWGPVGSPRPDFWRLILQDFTGAVWWDLVVPGARTDVTLPSWPEGAATGLFPAGSLFVIAQGVDAASFEMDDFDINDFRSANWKSYSLNAFVITNPAPEAAEAE